MLGQACMLKSKTLKTDISFIVSTFAAQIKSSPSTTEDELKTLTCFLVVLPSPGQFSNHTVTPTHRCCSLKVLIGRTRASNGSLPACLQHKPPTALRVSVFPSKIRSHAKNLSCLTTALSSSHTAERKAARSTTHQVGKVAGFTNASPFNIGLNASWPTAATQ